MGENDDVIFGDFVLRASDGTLHRGSLRTTIRPKPLALLRYLVKNRHRIVQKEELLDAVWPGVVVSEQAIASALRDLRRALGDSLGGPQWIMTVRGRGFRFVELLPAAETAPAVTPREAGVSATSHAAMQPEFVGRDDSMRSLLASASVAIKGTMQVSFLVGPAGIGKTRLANELAQRAADLGFDVHTGRCHDGEGAPSFWPWTQIIRGCRASEGPAGHVCPTSAAFVELASLAPDLATRTADEVRIELGGLEARFRLFDGIARYLRDTSQQRPLLLVLDDLHWADDASLLLLEFLMQTVVHARIHLVVTLRRPQGQHPSLARVLGIAARQDLTESIHLSGIDDASIVRLLASVGRPDPSPVFVEAVRNATAGNPLFVTQLVKLVGSGKLDSSASSRIPVPDRVQDFVRWQLDRLSPECGRILRAASVLGREFDLGVLSLAVATTHERALDSIGEAEAMGVVVSIPSRPSRFAFAHDIVRESIYCDLPSPERVRLHRCIAEALEALPATDTDARDGELAYHYFEAVADGGAPKALHFARLSGDRANARLAFEEAVTQYGRALAAISLTPEPAPLASSELLLVQAEAAWGTQESAAKVQERFVAAACAARAAGDAQLFARAALGRSGHGAGLGDYRDISLVDEVDIALLSEARSALGAAPSELLALVLARLALAMRLADGLGPSDALSRDAVNIAERVGAPSTLAMVLRYRHEVISGPAFAAERGILAERIVELARSYRLRALELDGLYFRSRSHFELADAAVAKAFGDQADAIATTMGHSGAAFRSGIRRVLSLTLVGAFDAAERTACDFYERDACRNIGARGTFLVQRATLRSLRGDHRGAIHAANETKRLYPRVTWAECLLVREYALVGQHVESRGRIDALAADRFRGLPDDHSLLGSLMHLADACWVLAYTRHAPALRELLEPFETVVAAPFLGTLCQGAVARALGTLAAQTQEWSVAERHFACALAIDEGLQSPPLIALTLERFGNAILRHGPAGGRGRAHSLLGRAAAIADRLGMRAVHSGAGRDTGAASGGGLTPDIET